MQVVSTIQFPEDPIAERDLCENLWFKPDQVSFSPLATVYTFVGGKYILPLPSVKFKIALSHLKDGSPSTVRRISDPQVRRFYTALLVQYGLSNGFSFNMCLYLTGSPLTWESNALKNYPELKPMHHRRMPSWRDPVGFADSVGARATRSRSEASAMPDTDVDLPLPDSWNLDDIVKSLDRKTYSEVKPMKYEAPASKAIQESAKKPDKVGTREALRWWIIQAASFLDKGSHFQASMLTMSLCAICDQADIYSDHSRVAYRCAVNNNWSTLRGEFTRWIAEL